MFNNIIELINSSIYLLYFVEITYMIKSKCIYIVEDFVYKVN